MLPRKQRIREVALGLLILCVSSGIVAAGAQRPNPWHDGPITCYTCSSAEDCADGAGRLRTCVNNDAQTCLVVFDEAGAVKQRGCSDAVAVSDGAYCESNAGHCPSCESSGCNDATALDQYVECVACDSLHDPDCVLRPAAVTTSRSCNGGCLTALRPIASGDAETDRHSLIRSCLNDLDVDDREACAADEGNAQCSPCTGAKCNVRAMPEERHSCYHCVDDCEDQEVHECVVFSEDDKCYVHYVQPDGVVGMGCISDFASPAEVLALIRRKELQVCEGNNCNDFNKLPRPEECVTCSSAEIEQCATLPAAVLSTERCSAIPYTQCYQRVDASNGGITERGCLAALEEDLFYDCLTGADAHCKICAGEDCNTEIVPADRPRCQRCDSTSDLRCQALPAALGVCPRYDADETCVALYSGGVTRRGCRSEFDCDAAARNCQVCSGDGCNTLNLKKRTEEIYGVLQDLPINCYTCEGDDCRGTEGVLRKCEGDPFQDCMTVMNSKNEVLSRGCEDSVLAEQLPHAAHCADHPHHCFRCKSNGCNVITDVDTPALQCRYCDSAAQPDCLFAGGVGGATRRCVEGCVTALYERKSDPAVRDLVRTCYEDIEPDDRDACTAENNCVRCTDGDECNDVQLPSLPAERLTCLHCDGADCGVPESRQCLGYDAADQCYIYFDNVTLGAVRMGCRSEFTRPHILAEIKQFFLCDGNDCNDYAALPEANFCFSCSSRSDENCAVAPSKLSARNRCQILPHTECYTRITEDGHTERGCLQSLPTDVFVTCLDGAPTSICRICTESDCNRNVYPGSRQQCFRCNSSSDAECATAPLAATAQPCPLYDTDDACVTKLEGDATVRACASELQCAPGDGYKECRTCSGRNNCNNIDLRAEDVGPPGIFQQPPLNCYHCRGEAECAEDAAGVNVCSGDPLQTCTTAFAANGSVVARGCSDAIDPICASLQNGACFECKSSGCNTATSRDDYVDCLFCDASDNEACVLDAASVKRTRPCHKSCMTALYPRTDDPQPAYELIRTCLDDMDLDEREACSAGSDPDKCVACGTDSCNTATVGERMSCYQCVDDECLEPTVRSCRATIEHEQCFLEYDEAGSVVRQGCKSDYDPDEVRLRVGAQRMWLCDEDDCNVVANQPEAQNCALCSSRTDPNCATAPDDVTGVTLCPSVPYTQCYSRVLDGGHTERGCLSSLAADDFYDCLLGRNTTACLACEGALCNSKLFPSDRRSCHVCSSADSSSCETSPSAPQVCLKYSPDEQCATVVTEQGVTERGCSSVLSCDPADGASCDLCDGDNCNAKNLRRKLDGRPGLWQPLPLTCHSCSSAADCEAPATSVCAETDYCMTVFEEDGAVAYRGCSSAVELQHGDYCDLNSEHCFNCNSNECNAANSLDEYVDCVYCDSTRGAECVSQPTAIGQRRKCHQHCMSALLPRNDNGAFELVRSCLDDKDAAERSVCLEGDTTQCAACDTAACNVALLPPQRRSCLTCVGDACMDAASAECRQYDPDDGCFMLFDERGDITRLGCLSELSYAFLADNALSLYTCTDADDCNGFENVPQPTRCAVCSSATDPQCATHPDDIPESAECSSRPNTQCYTRITSGGQTERGCVNSLDKTVAAACLAGNSAACTTCHSDLCNTEIYPADRRQCQRCNSKDDPQCESSPAAPSPCPIFEDGDVCSAKLVNGHTYRGCGSDFLCDPFDPQFCRVCADADNCNVVDLAAGNIGYPGQWTPAPINCFVCSGAAECAAPDPTTLHKCEGSELQNCATVFDANGSVVQRSCSDAVYADATTTTWCDANPEACKFCKSSGCNEATSRDDFVECVFCDGTTSADCISAPLEITRTRSCHRQCVAGLYPRSDDPNGPLELARGCLDDLDEDDREACAAGDRAYCVACSGERCNTAAVPAERHSCYKCAGEACEDAEPQACSSYLADDQCYTLYDSEYSVAGKGCRSDLESGVAEELVRQKQLRLCEGPNCNDPSAEPTPKLCSVCNSEDDARCATNPNLVANIERCSALPYTDCYTRVSEDGFTNRGCLASLDEDAFVGCLRGADGLCETCSGDRCNEIDVFPAGRFRCEQCSSLSDPLCAAAPNSNKVCPVYSASDACVTTRRDGVTRRGCASSFACDDPSDKRNCRVCSTPGCNTVDLAAIGPAGEPGRWQDVPLSCHTCAGAEECAGDDAPGPLRVCLDNPYQNCATVFDAASGAVVRRGCSDAVATTHGAFCAANADHCAACNSNGCNVAAGLSEYVQCWACDTDASGACVNDLAAVTAKRSCHKYCMVAMYPLAEESDPAYGLTRSCLDDMDYDEREACSAGNEPDKCVACGTDSCNTAALPATTQRLSCNMCVGEECQAPQPATCPTYRPTDHCYIRYDERRSVVAMGCRSAFSSAEADYLLREQRLFVCAGDNCNTYEAVPEPQTCRLCNSRTDLDCATRPDRVTSSTRCEAKPFTQCYSRVLPDGATERGCLASLYDDEFQGCLNGTASHCEVCSGDECNAGLYPSPRLSCHICDSASDPGCEARPDNVAVCPKYADDDTCITAYRDEVTYRGCSSSSAAAWGCSGSSASAACSTCRGDACNTINLAKRQDDNHGMWQDLPLRCWTCSGEAECAAAATTTTATCANNNEQDCLTVFDAASGAVVRRGCEDAVEADFGEYCDANAGSCFGCKSNECNSATRRDSYVDCVYCNSHKNPDCVANPLSAQHATRSCQGGCMAALFPSDSSTSPVYDLIRTCLDDKEAAAQSNCSAGSDPLCRACVGDKCNVYDLPEDRQRCLSCEGDACEDPQSALCPLYKPADQCFIWFDDTNSVAEMGCASKFRGLDFETVVKTKRVLLCDGADCNTLDRLDLPQKCAVCDSSSDANCAIRATDVTTFESCTHQPYTSCYSKLNADGSTVRGCLADLPADDFAACVLGTDANCGTCKGDGCNREVFPADRQQCYVCTTEDDDDCESFPTLRRPCPVVSEREACVSALSGNVTVRGCSTELKCDTSDSRTCRACFGTGCNAIDLRNKLDDGYHGVWQALPLRCHTCAGDHCHNSLGPALNCTRNTEQDCATVFEADGAVRRRGCSDDVDDYEDVYCRLHPHLCHTCKSNECNDAWDLTEFVDCAFCDSLNDPLCVVNPENAGFAVRSCRKECMVAMRGQQVIRSCLDDKELFVQHQCRTDDGGETCASCSTDDCNKFVFPADRLKCHVCTGTSCTSSYGQYCSLYEKDDFCFAKYEGGRVELMGCGSAANASDIAEWTAQKKLYRCEGSDCNDLTKLPAAGVCVACDSSKTPNCAQSPAAVRTTESCQAPSNECVTRINAAGHTLRGCLSALDASEQNCVANGTCEVCSYDLCNHEIYPAQRRQCHICNSVADKECAKSPIPSFICPVYAANDKCVSKNTDGYIERGCASELSCDVNDKKYCQICDDDRCNTADVSGAAGQLAGGSLLWSLLVAAATIVAMRRH